MVTQQDYYRIWGKCLNYEVRCMKSIDRPRLIAAGILLSTANSFINDHVNISSTSQDLKKTQNIKIGRNSFTQTSRRVWLQWSEQRFVDTKSTITKAILIFCPCTKPADNSSSQSEFSGRITRYSNEWFPISFSLNYFRPIANRVFNSRSQRPTDGQRIVLVAKLMKIKWNRHSQSTKQQ